MRQSTTSSLSVASILTLLILVLLPVASGVGLLVPSFYRDTAWMIPQARGQDLVTLVVAEPLLLAAFIGARRSRVAAPLLWMGALAYILYTYAMYSYTAFFNALFLVYVALFSASLFALIDLLVHLDLQLVRQAVRPSMPRRTVAGYLAFVGLFFLAAWLGQIVPALLHGAVPDAVVLAKTPTSAVHVQDLGIVIPLLILAAIWLWQRRPWGFVLGGPLLVLADVMLLALLSMSVFSAQAGIAGALDLFWVFVALNVVSLGVTALLFTHLRRPTVDVIADNNLLPTLGAGTDDARGRTMPLFDRVEQSPESDAVARRSGRTPQAVG